MPWIMLAGLMLLMHRSSSQAIQAIWLSTARVGRYDGAMDYPAAVIEAFLDASATDNARTWREWIGRLLVELEREGEGFSGKRPLGNSDWWWHLAAGLTAIDPEIATTGIVRDASGELDGFEPDHRRVSAAWQAVAGYLSASRQPMDHGEASAAIDELEDLLGSIWLCIDWKYVTRQLTTQQKEHFADAVARSHHRLEPSEPFDSIDYWRWWR